MATHTRLRYAWPGGAILRATTHAAPADIPRTLDLDDPAVVSGWLRRQWQDSDVQAALHTASPTLCDAVEAILSGATSAPRTVRRTALSVASYLLRWSDRPTPFGLFAGVASLTVGADVRAVWSGKHQMVVRADSSWLTDVIQQLQRDPLLLERLRVVANNTAVPRGDRIVAPGPPADGRTRLLAPVEVSLPARRPVRTALELARAPITYRDLREELTARFPAGAGGRIDALLADLVAQNLLSTSLRAPMTTVDALAYLCAELERAGAHDLPVTGSVARELDKIRRNLGQAEPSVLADVADRMVRMSTVTRAPLLVDTALDVDAEIPREVIAEAERAAAALYRTSPQPYGYPHWRDFHRRFRARYGVGAVVPVLELVADSGLGWPAGFVGSERGKAPAPRSDRDTVVLALVEEALRSGRGEIVLTDTDVDRLARAAGQDEPLFIDRTELAFEVRAASTRDVRRGAFRLALTGVPRPGSSMAGRFLHLLPADQHKEWAGSFTTDSEAVTAQLAFTPRRRRDENVARTARLLPAVIPLAEHTAPAEGAEMLALEDIAVTADARRLHLVQISTGRRIEPRVLHALEAGTQTPPLARLLAEATGARCAVWKPFDFGAAARLPHLPRVRYRRTILSPARWLLTTDDLPDRRAETGDWDEAFTAWRARMRVPDRVAMVHIEQRLPVDLTHPVHRRLLRARLEEAGRLELRETADPDAYGWIGRPHEVLIPLTRSLPEQPHGPAVPATAAAAEPHLPGAGRVLRAHLHAHPLRYDELLDLHLLRLLDAFDTTPVWWFTRERVLARPEDGQHLALTLHLPEGCDYSRAAAHVNTWAQQLHRARLAADLTLAGYRPQTGRYGHGPAMGAAHRVFAADSAAALTQLRLANTNTTSGEALAAASMLDLACALAPGEGADWLVEHLPQGSGRIDPTTRDEVLRLTTPPGGLAELPGGQAVETAWQERADALRDYRETVAAQRDPTTVLRSLLHQHHIRVLPVDANTEAATLRLTRTAALRRIKAAS